MKISCWWLRVTAHVIQSTHYHHRNAKPNWGMNFILLRLPLAPVKLFRFSAPSQNPNQQLQTPIFKFFLLPPSSLVIFYRKFDSVSEPKFKQSWNFLYSLQTPKYNPIKNILGAYLHYKYISLSPSFLEPFVLLFEHISYSHGGECSLCPLQ